MAEYYSALGAGKLALSAGTFKLARGVHPGLYEGVQDFADETSVKAAFAGTSTPHDLVMRGIHSSNMDNEFNYTKPNPYRLITYAGYVWNRSATNAEWSIVSSVNGPVNILLDGKSVLSTTAASLAKATVTLKPGATKFEYRAYNNSPLSTSWVAKKGFACKAGAASDTAGDYALGVDPGDGSLFTLTDETEDGTLALGDAAFSTGATLDLNGRKVQFSSVTGAVTVASSAADPLATPEVTVTGELAATLGTPVNIAGTLHFGSEATVSITVPSAMTRVADAPLVVTTDGIDLGGRTAASLADFGSLADRWRLVLSEDGKSLMAVRIIKGTSILVK